MVAKHVINGINETSFAPLQPVTRAEFATMIARRLSLKPKGKNLFTDVNPKKWYVNEVTAAAEAGIVNGRTSTMFAPDDVISRQEMAVMLMNAYEIVTGIPRNADRSSSFADADKIGNWAIASVNAANKLGFVQGKGGNRFAPRDTATRAEAVQMISNLLK